MAFHLSAAGIVSIVFYAIYVSAAINFPSSDNQIKDNQQQQQEIHDFARIKPIRSLSGQRMFQVSRSKIPIELDVLVDNGELLEKAAKRYDDYGHLRFGKRAGEDQFDDYGHMRFGRSTA